MEFRIADTFTSSLSRLTADEQKAVKTSAFDLQLNPASPGLSFHKLDRARDKSFWSVRVNRDIRLIVHRSDTSLLLCYVDHHDKAYAWAERRKLETHPKTGAAQLVEIRETFQEILVPQYVEAPAPPLFAKHSDEDLLRFGVPLEWIQDVKQARSDDQLLALAAHLPAEAAEALLVLATGGTPYVQITSPESDPFAHPDAQRRFRVMSNVEELARALDAPWEKWTIFLHPAQRAGVERSYAGPARVSGSAGTGKTIVALHRAVHLAKKDPDARVLLATFSHGLANALRSRLRRLVSNEPRVAERIDVRTLDELALELYRARVGVPRLATRDHLVRLFQDANGGLDVDFLLDEWTNVVDAWQLATWEAYRDVRRLGRKTRLAEKARALHWQVFERVRGELARGGVVTMAAVMADCAEAIAATRSPYDVAVIDEAQDLAVAQLRFVVAIGRGRPNAVFFAGDLGQRIFQQPFSWKSLGVDVRGRSVTLDVNYRTTHQIRSHADRLLAREVTDADGNLESRANVVSVLDGPPPELVLAASIEQERDAVAAWLTSHLREGLQPHELAIIVRTTREIARAVAVARACGIEVSILDDTIEPISGQLSICTMHYAKGLEFRAVAVMACDDEVIPLQSRIEAIADEADLEDVYTTERHLLYVACTRARDFLLVSGVRPGSEFIRDLAS